MDKLGKLIDRLKTVKEINSVIPLIAYSATKQKFTLIYEEVDGITANSFGGNDGRQTFNLRLTLCARGGSLKSEDYPVGVRKMDEILFTISDLLSGIPDRPTDEYDEDLAVYVRSVTVTLL